ncbi:MAG: FAD-dependent monooxygenase [Afipia sp.]|nr:FAD-dependent monooxygenase [Afipia sp.]
MPAHALFEEHLELFDERGGPRTLSVGAGPVGMTAALLLAHYGIDTVLLEKNETTSNLPRAIAIDDEYMRLLHRVGLGDAIRGHTSKPFGIHFISPFGLRLVEVPGFVTPNGFGNRNAVLQPVFEKILLQGLRRTRAAKVRFGAEVTGLRQSDEGVTLEVKERGQIRQLSVSYLLGCDGARSYVRSALQISFEGKRIDAPHLVVDLAEFPDQADYSRFFCNPKRPVNSIPGPYGGRRLEFMLLADDDHGAIVSDAGIQSLVDKHTPYAGTKLSIIRRAIYGFSERIAQRLQEKRAYLLGDAAHVMPPFGGQGMNSGARDAANLSWKIAGVLRGCLNPKILETYEQERRRHIRQIVDYSVWIGKLANIRSLPLALLRDVLLGALNSIPPVRRFFSSMRYMPKPYFDAGFVGTGPSKDNFIGRMLPLLHVIGDAGGAVSLDDITGPSFALVGFDVAPSELVALSRQGSWPAIAPLLVCISEKERELREAVLCVRPGDDRCKAIVALHSGKVAAIRPDGYVACLASIESFQPASRNLDQFIQPMVREKSHGAM